jgi:antitoxin VapB
MTTTLPADPDTECLAHKLAEATGRPLSTIVKEAIAAKAEAAGVSMPARKRLAGQDLIDRMTAISDQCAALPILDPRSADEIIGYDEFGVPS